MGIAQPLLLLTRSKNLCIWNVRSLKAEPQLKLVKKNGAGDRNRTDDLLITNQLLYQLSYTGSGRQV